MTMLRPTDQIILKFRDVLAATELLAPSELQAYQRQLLIPLLQHCRANIPFYAARLEPLFSGGAIDLDRWPQIPILTRAEAQASTAAMAASRVPPNLGEIARDETSGSTGRPLAFTTNGLQAVAARAMTDRLYRWWGFDGNGSMATFISRRKVPAAAPNGVSYRGWMTGRPTGLHHWLDMSADTGQQLDWLLARRPDYLTAYSSTLRPLAELARARGVDLRLRRIIGVSNVLSGETRTLCKEVFGAHVIDQYGADEVGSIATECPCCTHYHVAAEGVLVEIADEAGRDCAPGEMGRVIVTPLYAYATPFIRYELGDYAVAGPADEPCRVKLPRLSRIVGRFRNTFRLAGGRIVYPLFSIARMREFVPMAQFQVVQTAVDAVDVRYVPLPDAAPPDLVGLTTYLRGEIDPAISVTVTAVAAIERSPDGKFEDFVSLVAR